MKTPDASVKLITAVTGEAVVLVSGELDIATEALLEEMLDMAESRSSTIHVDLEDVTFMDVRTVNVLDRRARSCRRSQGAFRVHNCTGQPRRVLHLCGLDALLD